MNYTITHPQTTSEFDAYYKLRWEELRKPWNQPFGSERDECENVAVHIMAVDENENIAGVCRLHFIDPDTAQVRYMAVKEGLRGKGIGEAMLLKAEKFALEKEIKRIFLQSREQAVPFYIRNGYHIIEKTFLMYEVIQHFSMEKKLT